MRLLVDGMNVIGSRPNGWWRDRDGARRDLAARLRLLAESGERITVVFDGAPLPDLPEGEYGGVEVLYARRKGRDAADERIVEVVSEHPGPWRVVTSDRALRQRVESLGGVVESPSALLRGLDRLESDGLA
jgi:predicted RNA-binding protein with PIN domain